MWWRPCQEVQLWRDTVRKEEEQEELVEGVPDMPVDIHMRVKYNQRMVALCKE